MEFQTLGYKSVSMGGASVASSAGSIATYNNPALLAKSEYDVEVSLGGGVAYHDYGAGASIEALDSNGFLDTLDRVNSNVNNLSNADIANLQKGIGIIKGMNGDAAEALPQLYLSAQISQFGFGIFGSSDGIATAQVDTAHDQLIFKDQTLGYAKYDPSTQGWVASNAADYQSSSIEYAIDNGLTYLDTRGYGLVEVPIAYGHKFELSGGNLMVGGALKYMRGVTYTEKIKIDGDDDATSIKREQTTNNIGIDIGLAYVPSFSNDLTFGLVGKNLNSPKFNFVDGTDVKISPMVRFGVAYNILDSLEFAADVDLTKNETLRYDVDSQMLGGGLNYHPTSWFALRGGLMSNLDSNDPADLIYTAGIGIGFKWLQIDISAQMSDSSTTVDGEKVPEYAKANIALISRW
jgi:hypothetical protein